MLRKSIEKPKAQKQFPPEAIGSMRGQNSIINLALFLIVRKEKRRRKRKRRKRPSLQSR
jgi:hypothetical protein